MGLLMSDMQIDGRNKLTGDCQFSISNSIGWKLLQGELVQMRSRESDDYFGKKCRLGNSIVERDCWPILLGRTESDCLDCQTAIIDCHGIAVSCRMGLPCWKVIWSDSLATSFWLQQTIYWILTDWLDCQTCKSIYLGLPSFPHWEWLPGKSDLVSG